MSTENEIDKDAEYKKRYALRKAYSHEYPPSVRRKALLDLIHPPRPKRMINKRKAPAGVRLIKSRSRYYKYRREGICRDYMFPIDPNTGLKVIEKLAISAVESGEINWKPVTPIKHRTGIIVKKSGKKMIYKRGHSYEYRSPHGRKDAKASDICDILKMAEDAVESSTTNTQDIKKSYPRRVRHTESKQ